MNHKSTAYLKAFQEQMKKRGIRIHGAVLMSGGQILDEFYNTPYTEATKTRMYSSTKSVAALAIGKLVTEGRLSLDARIVDLFADRFDMSEVHPLLREQTVRHMLTMHTVYSSPTYSQKNSDWLASYFRATPTHPAGTLWYYDSSGSYVLGAVTKHLTGMDFVEYLRPEFDVMGISPDVYCLCGPDGEAWASSGLIATTADLARIAYLLVNGGKWGDRQLISREFVRDAISPLVSNDEIGTDSYYCRGYGYQIWGHTHGGFAFRGLGGQIAIGFPEHDLVFACNSDASVRKALYDEIFDAVETQILPQFMPIESGLEENVHAPTQPSIPEKVFRLEQNSMHIETIAFEDGEDDTLLLCYTKAGVQYRLPFAVGRDLQVIFPEQYTGERLFDKSTFMNYSCTVEASVTHDQKLKIRVWAEDLYVGNMTMIFSFPEDGRIALCAYNHAQFFFTDMQGYVYGNQLNS